MSLPIDRRAAWGCLIANLLLPGLGTFIAQRRVTGACQFIFSQLGFVATLVWASWFVMTGLRTGHFPCEELNLFFWIGVGGAGLFTAVWTWTLVTSINIIRAARRNDS